MCDLVLDNQRRREVADAVGLSFTRVRALRRIDPAPITMGALAAALAIDAPNATQVVDDLESLGLVERRPHPTDRRVKLVVTTGTGADAVRTAEAILHRPPEGLASLPRAQLAVLARTLEAAREPTDPAGRGG
jgi:DNA-binding MarR family transcriptional regulator